MCKIEIPDHPLQLLIQTIDCKLSLYQGDQCVFVHCPLRSLHPGPIKYSQLMASLLIANNGFLNSVKFSLLSSGSQKRINYDWSFNLGDTALELDIFDGQSNQQNIVVLCRRHVSCFDGSGAIKWQIKLESVGMAMCTYRNLLAPDYQSIRLIIGTADEQLLIFNEDKLAWTCSISKPAFILKVCTFTKVFENVITMLAPDGRLCVGWLGTEPTIYKVPDTKMNDYNEKIEYWKSLELKIKESGGGILEKNKKISGISIDFLVGAKEKRTIEHNAANNVPFLNLEIVFGGLENVTKLHVNIKSELATPNRQIVLNVPESKSSSSLLVPFYVGNSKMPKNATIQIAAHCFHSQISGMKSFDLPFDLMFGETTVDRNSKYKITIDTDASVIPVNQLFSEFSSENTQAIGFHIHGYESSSNVSIFAANKSNRYRIQSENASLLQFAAKELVNRIDKIVKNVQIGSTVPFEYISKNVEELQERMSIKKKEQKIIDCRMKEVRAIELLSLDMAKSGNFTSLAQIDMLFDKSYRELLDSMENLAKNDGCIEENKNCLASLFQLASDISKYNKCDTIINENFFTFTDQNLRDRLTWAAGTDRGNEMKLIEKLCEHTTTKNRHEMQKIEEENEGEE
ncbi:unnamed protein product [Caenorhabditis angaria]|uniref:Protein PTHB1 n=1 Tax=Caenorhabditis angaria TaxID=860376 RepID=A0A9P1MTK6_9PELO|nr:unnamed protein product [Caenorhabditis angaria]